MTPIGIIGVGHAVPDNDVKNVDLVAMGVETTDEWIRERTGISARRIADADTNTSDLAIKAAQQAIDRSGINPDDIGVVICATSTPDFGGFPSTACLVQRALGLGQVPAFDIAAACTGFNYALECGELFVSSGKAKAALVIAGDCLSKVINWDDRSTCVLFGDGAGAVVLSNVASGYGIIKSTLYSDGTHSDILKIEPGVPRKPFHSDDRLEKSPYIVMKGPSVYKVAVASVQKSVEQILADANVNPESLDAVIFHQANLRIMNAVRDRLGLSEEKVLTTIEKYGNTSAASIPITLSEHIESGHVKEGDLILMVGFGGGFTWATTLVRYGGKES
ncbi:ketoacyl-ACP synthase III [bacterium]|jgi:3-oxoacyl-[acyl-carrier-protein] synthase III|nr:ketoacyl-ACP synthase III [bacterium]